MQYTTTDLGKSSTCMLNLRPDPSEYFSDRELLTYSYVLRCGRWGEGRRNYTYLSSSLTTPRGLAQT